jgi:murein DD-endopeptidase MepM/ murein hydrolase activator NlpD
MSGATRSIGRRLGVLGAVLCLTVAGITGTAGAAPTSVVPPKGIEVLSPQEDQTISATPVPVRLRFNTAIQPGSFAAELNGKDVTARFAVGSDAAGASLAEADGIRISTDKNRQSNTLHVWMTALNDPSHRYHDRRAFVVKSSGEGPKPVSGVISPDGGTLDSPGVGSVTFPAGAFLTDTTVEISVTRDTLVQQLFDETAVPLFDAANRLGYEVRITTGTVQPLLEPKVTLALPDSFRFDVTPGSEVRIFAENFEDGSEATLDAPASILDNFEVLSDRFLASDLQATAAMPVYYFTDGLRTDGVFELVILAATTPTAAVTTFSASSVQDFSAAVATGEDAQLTTGQVRSSLQAADTCKGSSLAPPLDGDLTETSQFGPRTHPVTGKKTNHGGTDLKAATGTPVKAMADGVVERSGYQLNTKTGTGWGEVVVIRHTDGSKTLYAHLEPGTRIAQGQTVSAGDVIGKSDSSGGVTGPHLHIEYAPNGKIYDKASKVDPMPCIGDNVIGSITVRDNGNLADDAFSVAIDGLVVCTTQIGQSNTCSSGNLRPGTRMLSVTVIVAPDNVGTFEVTLGDGLTFANGGTVGTGANPLGSTVTVPIIVPSR